MDIILRNPRISEIDEIFKNLLNTSLNAVFKPNEILKTFRVFAKHRLLKPTEIWIDPHPPVFCAYSHFNLTLSDMGGFRTHILKCSERG